MASFCVNRMVPSGVSLEKNVEPLNAEVLKWQTAFAILIEPQIATFSTLDVEQ